MAGTQRVPTLFFLLLLLLRLLFRRIDGSIPRNGMEQEQEDLTLLTPRLNPVYSPT